MRLKIMKLLSAMQGLAGLGRITLDDERRKIVKHAYLRLEPQFDQYEIDRIELVREHRKETEDGQVIWQNPDAPLDERTPEWKNQRAWEDALKKLQEREVDVDLHPLKRRLLKRLNIAAEIEIRLEPIMESEIALVEEDKDAVSA